jgi:hypothetical protein
MGDHVGIGSWEEVREVAFRVPFDVRGVASHKQDLALAPIRGHDIEDGLKQQQGVLVRSLPFTDSARGAYCKEIKEVRTEGECVVLQLQ